VTAKPEPNVPVTLPETLYVVGPVGVEPEEPELEEPEPEEPELELEPPPPQALNKAAQTARESRDCQFLRIEHPNHFDFYI
jgi:hypothetical protein